MLSEKESPNTRTRPPDVQDPIQRSSKKSKRIITNEEALVTTVEMEEAPDMPEAQIPQEKPFEANTTVINSYKQSLRSTISYNQEDIAEEDASEDELVDEPDDPSCPRIRFSKEEKARIRRPCRRSLIIRLLGKSVGYTFLHKRLQSLWKPEGQMELIDLDQDYFLARFEFQSDYDYARFEGPWMILDHYLIVHEWTPNFNPRTNKTEKILAWIRMPALPIEYFDENSLMRIGNSVGRAIRVDDTTSLTSRGKFARICVELDITKPLLSKFDIEGSVYPIEYEGIHLVCFQCGIFGHRKEQCTENEAGTMPKNSEQMELDTGQSPAKERNYEPPLFKKSLERDKIKEEKFGSWMLVTRRDRRASRPNGQKGKPWDQQAATRNPKANMHTVYNNQLYNSRFAPIGDLDEDQLDGMLETAFEPRTLLHGESSRGPGPGYTPVENLALPFSPPLVPRGIKTFNTTNRGRGGRMNTPHRAAAQTEHVVVRGSTKG